MCPDCGTVFLQVDSGDGFNQDNMQCDRPLGGFSAEDIAMAQSLHPCEEFVFWYWIQERHRIYVRRQGGMHKPWSQDRIFQKYKFVNVFRRLDRTTDWLCENFLNQHGDADLSLKVFNICWYRMFCRWETGAQLGWQDNWDVNWAFDRLSEMTTPVFTGAYIIHSETGESKLTSILSVCSELWRIRDEVLHTIDKTRSMKATYECLQQLRHVGPFMAYQMVLDMMYVRELLSNAVDRNTWTCTGPGALRGLRRLDPATQPKETLDRMLDLTRRSRENLPDDVPDLTVHDIEFALCELDKYCRVKFGEGRPRSTYPGVK